MISMKVDNDQVWAYVKAGKVKGFSIEGYFADKLQMSRISKEEKQLQDIAKILQSYGKK